MCCIWLISSSGTVELWATVDLQALAKRATRGLKILAERIDVG